MEKDDQEAGEEKPTEVAPERNAESAVDDGDFSITIRKLELPVRPRGVLAE